MQNSDSPHLDLSGKLIIKVGIEISYNQVVIYNVFTINILKMKLTKTVNNKDIGVLVSCMI